MSSDAYGVPQRKYDFGKDVVLAGQIGSGGQYRMQQHGIWARADAAAAAAGDNVYLVAEVPPLPAGSIIRAQVDLLISGASDTVELARITDPLLVTGGTATALAISNANVNGLITMMVVVRNRGTTVGATLDAGGTTRLTVTSLDWMRNNYLGIVMAETTAITAASAYIEVFIPRAYR